MMALVSELSMNQANALKLQQNLKEKEADLEQCYIRMEKGEAPSDEIQAEWFKILRDEDRRSRDKEEIRLVNFISSLFSLKRGFFIQISNQCCCIIQGYDKCKSFNTQYWKQEVFKRFVRTSSLLIFLCSKTVFNISFLNFLFYIGFFVKYNHSQTSLVYVL